MSRKLLALALAGGLLLGAAGASIRNPSQDQSPPPVRSRAEETLEWWNHIGNKLIALAKDFPEDKYDFKAQKDERTFAQNLLHVAAVDYDLIGKVSGSTSGPDFGKDKHNPSRDIYKTKADVVKLLEAAVADGAAVIKQQGDVRANHAFCVGNRETRGSRFLRLDDRHRAQLRALRPASGLLPGQ